MSAEVSAALALALGYPVPVAAFSWTLVFDVARRERLTPLAWIRSASAIRAAAPVAVITAWRNEALSAVSLAEFWSRLTTEAVEALHRAGVEAVVLKGLPLSHRLYGDISARPCSDLDLHVPISQRSAAHQALVNAGWGWRIGLAPREGAYTIDREGRTAILEVHSTLLDDGLVSHLHFGAAGARSTGSEEDSAVVAHFDDQLPAFLASHLAKHAMPPLLWFVDFAELWRSLTPEEQRRSWVRAHAARAHRYLAWAIRRATDMLAAAAGDSKALQRLGFRDSRRADFHNAMRVAALAATPIDALRVAANWLVPVEARANWKSLVAHFRSRLRKPLRRALGTRRFYRAPVAARPSIHSESARALRVDGSEFSALVGDVSARDARFSIRARGSSMRPSVESGTHVCLTPRQGKPRIGSIVLAMTAEGSSLLHRIVRTGDGWIQTQGDGNIAADLPLAWDSVVAIADAIVVDGIERPIPVFRFGRSWRLARKIVAAVSRRRAAASDEALEASGE